MADMAKGNIISAIKALSAIIGFTLIIGGMIISAVMWFSKVQTIDVAEKQHKEIKSEMVAADTLLDQKATTVKIEVKKVGRDVKVIKCLLQAPNNRAKARCGLE